MSSAGREYAPSAAEGNPGEAAQHRRVEGGGSLLDLPGAPLKTTDPDRYGALVHPGDSFSYDIFSQAAQAVLRPTGPAPLSESPQPLVTTPVTAPTRDDLDVPVLT